MTNDRSNTFVSTSYNIMMHIHVYVCFGACSHTWYISSQIRISQRKRAVVKYLGSLVTRSHVFKKRTGMFANCGSSRTFSTQLESWSSWLCPFATYMYPFLFWQSVYPIATCVDAHQFQQIFSISSQQTKQPVCWVLFSIPKRLF